MIFVVFFNRIGIISGMVLSEDRDYEITDVAVIRLSSGVLAISDKIAFVKGYGRVEA